MRSGNNDNKINRWNIYSFVIISLVNFVVFTFAFRFFDKDVVGFYLLLTSVFMLGGSLDLGFGVATIKLISSAKTKGDHLYINDYFFTYLAAYVILVIFILILQYLYSLFSRTIFSFQEIGGVSVTYIYFLVAFNFIFTFLNNYLRCFLEGIYEYIFISKVSIVLNIVLLLFSFAVVLVNKNFLIFISINFIVSFLIFAIFLIKILSSQQINFKISHLKFKILKENLNYNFKLQSSFLIGNSLDYIIKFLISSMLSVGFVTIYEAGKKFITFINGFIYSYQKILFVKISELNSDNSNTSILNFEILKYSFNSLKMSIYFFGVLNPLICAFLYIWFDNLESMQVFLLLSLPFSLISFLISFYNVLIIEGRNHYLITIQTINVIMVTAFIYAGFMFFQSFNGLIGYYGATVISMYIIFSYFKKFHSFEIKKFFIKVEIYKIIMLNILIAIQLLILILNRDLLYFFIIFQVLYILLYYKDILYFFTNIKAVYLKN